MRQFILKKDLPTIKAGRVINISADGKFGSPILMEIEKPNCVLYMFPINILNENKDWFEEFEHDQNIIPTMPEEKPFVYELEFQRGDKVSFKGNDKFKALKVTYVWVMFSSMLKKASTKKEFECIVNSAMLRMIDNLHDDQYGIESELYKDITKKADIFIAKAMLIGQD